MTDTGVPTLLLLALGEESLDLEPRWPFWPCWLCWPLLPLAECLCLNIILSL